MSDNVQNSFNYPWAAAPDIIRANQKDAYFQSVLLTQLSSVIRSLYGTRSEHKWASEASVFTELLYLGLTTFLGNRTLGEEYCDIIQIEDDTHRLPALARRAAYILSTVLLPYTLSRFLPTFRKRLRAKLERTLRRAHHRRLSSPTRRQNPPTKSSRLQDYTLTHLDTLTSPAPLYALSLAVFYFSGAYYQLSKRVFGLRYIFTRKLTEADQRPGYEVLGVLLVVQMLVQSYLHMRATFTTPSPTSLSSTADAPATNPFDTPLLFDAPPRGSDPDATKRRIAQTTHTPLLASQHRYDLSRPEPMQWIEGAQARKCTLCLDAMKDPSVTTCGHVFCWTCVTDWLREQAMCPLCRQGAGVQHVLPLRG